MTHACNVSSSARASEFRSERQLREEREERDKQRRYVLPDLGVPLHPPHVADDVINASVNLPNIRSRPVLPSRVRFAAVTREGGSRAHSMLPADVTSSLCSQSTVSLPALQRGFTIQTVTQQSTETFKTDVTQTPATSSLTRMNVERANRQHRLRLPMAKIKDTATNSTSDEDAASSKRGLRQGKLNRAKRKRTSKSKAGARTLFNNYTSACLLRVLLYTSISMHLALNVWFCLL